MGVITASTAVLAVLLASSPADQPSHATPQSPPPAGASPIFNPGAPGAAARVITPAEAVGMSRTAFIDADVRFMQHMIVHHAQAVEMVELLRTRGASPVVQRLGLRIALSQESEIDLMTDWLVSRDQPLSAPDLHAGHGAGHGGHHGAHHGAGHGGHAAPDPDRPLMPGMLSPAQMTALAAASGAEFDRLFLEGMILHHQGAIDMVEALLAVPGAAEDPLLSDFANSVVADQSAEILRMQTLLSEP